MCITFTAYKVCKNQDNSVLPPPPPELNVACRLLRLSSTSLVAVRRGSASRPASLLLMPSSWPRWSPNLLLRRSSWPRWSKTTPNSTTIPTKHPTTDTNPSFCQRDPPRLLSLEDPTDAAAGSAWLAASITWLWRRHTSYDQFLRHSYECFHTSSVNQAIIPHFSRTEVR